MSQKNSNSFYQFLHKFKKSGTNPKSHHSCPKSGKIRNNKFNILFFILFPIVGLLSLIWFLVRVIPKPTRATYPCQRAAFPLASSFVIWLFGLAGTTIACRKASNLFAKTRYFTAIFCLTIGVSFIWFMVTTNANSAAIPQASDAPISNDPIGVAKGVNPGRVVWVHDPEAALWPGSDGDDSQPYWRSNECTNPEIVKAMFSKSIRTLAGKNSDSEAWDAIFKNFNERMGKGSIGYQPGEKITIKTNGVLNLGGNPLSQIDNAPQLAIALLRQLIDKAGIAPEDISIGDPQNPIVDYWYNMVHAECPGVVYLCSSSSSQTGRTKLSYDYDAPFYFSDPCSVHWNGVTKQDYIPDYFAQADYFINFPVLKSHNSAGVTLGAKNHFGSLMRAPNADGYYNEHNSRPYTADSSSTSPFSTPGMGYYRCHVDLMGHPKLGGKTILVLIDGLYGGRSWDSHPIRWEMEPFNGEWPCSIFLSQDQVAADSVAYDFLYNEWDDEVGTINGYPHYDGTEDYLHEAALAGNPPSGTFYDPARDGVGLQSLGVHEHWNNAIDKQYSRNLGTGDGIELIATNLYSSVNGPVHNVTRNQKYDTIQDAIYVASDNDYIVVSPGTYNEDIDFSGKNLTISSTDPNNPSIVASTIIRGINKALTLADDEDLAVITGLTITGAKTAIYCENTKPTITKCVIVENDNFGIELLKNASPNISNCEISCNKGYGIGITEGKASALSRPKISNTVIAANRLAGIQCNRPTITNCTIAANGQAGIEGTNAKIYSSIIFYNSASDSVQITGSKAEAEFSDIQGSWDGIGNIDQDPCFAEIGFWDTNDTPEDLSDDKYLAGDYHLLSTAGRFVPLHPVAVDPNADPNTIDPNAIVMVCGWTTDALTSPCIDAGDPNVSWSNEAWPHGKLLNMGAYGGTANASLSLSNIGDIRDINSDEIVAWDDASLLISKWNCSIAPLKEDLDLNGIVDVNDLIFFNGNWQEDSNNVVPQFDAVSNMNVIAGNLVTFVVSASDSDEDDELECLAVGLPDGATLSEQVFSWTPELEGTYDITFIATDQKSLAYMTVTITVTPASLD